MPQNQRIIFHIDMNAFFASVEQQANPLLRGKPIGVGGKPGTRSIIAAASYEAKRRGVKTAMSSYEALRLCPELTIVSGDSEAYAETNRRFVAIFKRYTHLVEVFSIDECWLDMTGYAKSYEEAKQLARRIKSDVRRELGEQITCSIGIAPNKLLAKLASDKEKPNGLFLIRPSGVRHLLNQIEPNELLGIGPRIDEHLKRLGIRTTTALAESSLELLQKEFGILGLVYKNAARGIDESPVISIESRAKSIGHSYTLPKDTDDEKILRSTLFTLIQKICRRLRRHDCLTRRLTTWCRYKNFEGSLAMQCTLDGPTWDEISLLEASWPIIRDASKTLPIRALGVSTHDLIHSKSIPLSVFKKSTKRILVTPALDKINNRFGDWTIQPFATLDTRLTRHVSGFKHAQKITPRSQ